MLFLNKLLKGVKDDPLIFRNPKIGFVLGLTSSQIKELKKFALSNCFIKQQKQEYYLTIFGEDYLNSHPIQSWRTDEFPKRPELNLEYLKEEKTPATVTKAIRSLARHFLDGEELKPNSMEEFIQVELLAENSKFQCLTNEIEEFFSSEKRVNLGDYYTTFNGYGLTKAIASVLLLKFISNHKNNIAVYEKYLFQLNINPLLFDKMMFNPENFEIQKTEFDGSPVLEEISAFVLPKKTSNVLDITKGLINFVRQLDKYVLQTEHLSTKAIKLRNAVINAKDPINLLTIDIPRIMQSRRIKDCDKEFVSNFRATLEELKEAKNNMVKDINAFTLSSFFAKKRSELSDRFKKIKEFIGSKELLVLFTNITDDSCSDNFWIERIAAYTNKSRVPKDWTDEDLADYKVKIKELALKFSVLESTVGTAEEPTSNDYCEVLSAYLKLSKAEQNLLLRKVVNG